MRDAIIIFIILVLVFGGGYFTEKYLEDSEMTLTIIIDELYDSIKSGNLGQIDKVEELNRAWRETKNQWHILGNHEEIDEIEAGLSRFTESYTSQNADEACLSLVEIRFRINDIHKGEKLELVNIL